MKLAAHSFIRALFLLTLCTAGFFTLASTAQANQLKGVRAWPSPDNTRVVLDLSSKPDYEISYLTHPARVVIDLKSTSSRFNLKKITNAGPLVHNFRESASGRQGTYRLVVDLRKVSKAQVFTLPPEKPYGHRLVLDLPHEQLTVKPIAKQQTQSLASAGRDVIIAIDAGHGGDDPGALGKYTQEKKINLEIAKRLQNRINQQKGMSAFLTRNGDYFVNLNKRSAIARKGKADFLVSIHADGFTSSLPSGASVWVLSNRRATTELGRWMEKHEAHSELLGGAGDLIQDSSSVPFLTEMFLDMSMGNAMDVGYNVGNLVVKELRQVTSLHNQNPVHASLAVLKSPDIPSILVEAGFITNRAEERLLNTPSHQNKIANAVFNGIYKNFIDAPPQDTMFAQRKRAIQHTVRSGESLSMLATLYSVTAKELQAYNNLKSGSLHTGQVIKVPAHYQLVVKQDPVQQVATAATPKAQLLLTQLPSVHRVARGESLSLIASHYGTTAVALKKHNNLRSTVLAVGQKIKIPGDVISPAPKAEQLLTKLPSVHRVKSGESLSGIADKYAMSMSELQKYNNLRSTNLQVGQKIQIPGDALTPMPQATPAPKAQQLLTKQPSVHRVKSGESLSGIAAKYALSMSELQKYNKLRSTVLAVGQKIKIPGDVIEPAPAAEAEQLLTKQPSVHSVKSGESLSLIASRNDTTADALKKHNNLNSTVLVVGQKIQIPGDDIAPAAQVTPAPKTELLLTKQPSVHRVKSGESLSLIASRNGTTADALKKHNNLRSTVLVVGQKIQIPGDDIAPVPQVTPAPKAEQLLTKQPTVHRVKSGESLSLIASRNGTTADALKKHNNLRSTVLVVGQKIKIPIAGQLTKHEVRSGESLSVIATRYGTTTNALKSFNKLSSNSLLIGQVLTIPVT